MSESLQASHNRNAEICAAIVTYNRKQLLLELLEAVRRQTYPVKTIVIVDNHSSDGTTDALLEKNIIEKAVTDEICKRKWDVKDVLYYYSSSNTGGSGGFQKAFEIAGSLDHDFVWMMDDDVEPEETCLETLLDAVSDDALVCIPNRSGNGWTERVATAYNLTNPFLVNVKQFKKRVDSTLLPGDSALVADMPFEGPLIAKKILKQAGVPDAGYFLFFDDSDYAQRILRYTSIRYVKHAQLKRKIARAVKKEAPEWRHYYFNRNAFRFDRLYGKNVLVRHFRPFFSCAVRSLAAVARGNRNRATLLWKAYQDAVKGRMGKRV